MTIPIKFLTFNETAPDRGYWDQFLLSSIIEHGLIGVDSFKIIDQLEEQGYGILIIPARQNVEYVLQINEYISRLQGVILVLTGDEESSFPIDQLHHPNMKIWAMTPSAGKKYPNVDRFIPDGQTPHFGALPEERPEKTLDWFLACQVNHIRRSECVQSLQRMINGELYTSDGFTKGLPQEEYKAKMLSAKIVPCPGGIMTPDSFRVFEALEAGCIPIVDKYSGTNMQNGYWEMIFGENVFFPMIENWGTLEGQVQYHLDTFSWKSNQIFAKWQMYKRDLKWALVDDFAQIKWQSKPDHGGLTVIIPTSPIASHPDTSILEEVIANIAIHLGAPEIIITFDGVRPEQMHLFDQYQEYIKRVLWLCNTKWHNVVPIVFKEYTHQVGMLREALKHVRTNKILYSEHDTPLTPDCFIDFKKVCGAIDEGYADLVRFHFEANIPEPHKHLMLDTELTEVGKEFNMIRTIQWSQRPHVASVDFYKKILEDHFSVDAKTFVEDKMHSIVVEAYKREQLQGWNRYKLWIYYPDENNIKRSYHTDGRGSDPKYDMTF